MILGIRCSNTDYSFALLKGKKGSPQVVNIKTASFPKGYTRPNLLRWLYQEIDDYFSKHKGISHRVVKGAEPMAQKGGSYTERVECEAMLFLAAANSGLTASRKVKPTIAKDLGLAGRAKALDEDLDTSPITAFQSYSTKEQEAVLAAWSNLKS
jgi:hypothetical protein